MIFDVKTVIRVRINATDINDAENRALDFLEGLFDSPYPPEVIETGFYYNPNNPVSVEVLPRPDGSLPPASV